MKKRAFKDVFEKDFKSSLINGLKNDLKMIFFVAAATALAASVAGCGAKNDSAGKINVGAKGFAENQLVARVIQYALEDEGFDVEYMDNLDGDVLQAAITTGQIDLYPEYTNTAIMTILKLPPVFDTDEAYEAAKAGFKEQYNIAWLDPTNVNDQYCFVLSKKTADRYDIRTISDLQANITQIRAAQAWDWTNRADLVPALEEKYGSFDFKEKTVYTGDLVYQILANDEGDLLIGNTTDPYLTQKDVYAVLADDKQVWPPYYLVPIIKQETLDKYPSLEDVINNVSAKLDTDGMIRLNAKVTLEHEEVADVAREFYDSQIKQN
jgi:osmoprotectant transport system substrate-binding protein